MYNYKKERAYVFTDSGQRDFLKVRDHVKELLDVSGAFLGGKAISVLLGDTWSQMACLDRLVEIGEIMEIPRPAKYIAWQHRVFVAK